MDSGARIIPLFKDGKLPERTGEEIYEGRVLEGNFRLPEEILVRIGNNLFALTTPILIRRGVSSINFRNVLRVDSKYLLEASVGDPESTSRKILLYDPSIPLSESHQNTIQWRELSISKLSRMPIVAIHVK